MQQIIKKRAKTHENAVHKEKKHSNAGFWAEAMSLAKNAIKMF